MEERAKQIAQLLKVLANEKRLLIVCALMEQAMTVGEIAKYVPNITQSALSQHLAMLKAHGILSFEKTGLNITYSMADNKVADIILTLKKNYCN